MMKKFRLKITDIREIKNEGRLVRIARFVNHSDNVLICDKCAMVTGRHQCDDMMERICINGLNPDTFVLEILDEENISKS